MAAQAQVSPPRIRHSYRKGQSPSESHGSESERSQSESPPPRHHKDMFGTFNQDGYFAASGSGAGLQSRVGFTQSVVGESFLFPGPVQAAPITLPGTPQKKNGDKRRMYGTPGPGIEESEPFDSTLHEHDSRADNHHRGPLPIEFSEATNALRTSELARKNRFTQGYLSKSRASIQRSGGLNADGASFGTSRVPPFRVLNSNMSMYGAVAPENMFDGAISMEDLDSCEDEDSTTIPSTKGLVCEQEDDTQSGTGPTRAQKGKDTQRNADSEPSGKSDGRPSVEVNQELERVGHKMQAELVDLSEKFGLSYVTVLRKVGFSRQQESREPNLANTFRKVYKHRLRGTPQRN